MLASLKNHPFAVEAFFDTSLVLTYAVPKEQLQPLIPECLQLDTHNDQWAFIAAAMVKTKGLRPKGFPAFMGNDFCLTGYRIFTRYVTNEGRRLRGLYILRSETDKPAMSFFGNLFTHYSYRTTDVQFAKNGNSITVRSQRSQLDVCVEQTMNTALPPQSPFTDWKEARRFAGPLPFTFTYTPATREVLIIEGVREHWEPIPVSVLRAQVGFIDGLQLSGALLANAFVIEQIPYYWKKGRTEIWKG